MDFTLGMSLFSRSNEARSRMAVAGLRFRARDYTAGTVSPVALPYPKAGPVIFLWGPGTDGAMAADGKRHAGASARKVTL